MNEVAGVDEAPLGRCEFHDNRAVGVASVAPIGEDRVCFKAKGAHEANEGCCQWKARPSRTVRKKSENNVLRRVLYYAALLFVYAQDLSEIFIWNEREALKEAR